MPVEDLHEALCELVDSKDPVVKAKASHFLDLLKRAREPGKPKTEGKEEDCPEGEEDCDETLSPCCQAEMHTIFGSLPLMVECFACGKKHRLSDVVAAL